MRSRVNEPTPRDVVQSLQGSDVFLWTGSVSYYVDVVDEVQSTGSRARAFTDLQPVNVIEKMQYWGET